MKKNPVFIILFALIIASSLFLIPSPLNADNFDVPGAYATIQAAIDAALLPIPGPISDTITIGPGIYNEHIVIDIPAGKQAGYTLYLEGSGSGSTIIDANAVSRVVKITGTETVYINNMTIKNGIAWGAGIANDAILYLDNCIVRDNNSGSHGGGLDNGMKGMTYISNCKILNNFAAISGGGIYNDGGVVTIEHSSIVGNTAIGGLSNGIDSPKQVIAKNNWWGSSSGPSGGMADPDTGTLANGSGDYVNGAVTFDPWLTSNPFAADKDDAESVWIRTMPMTCYRVWINEDNRFQFLFWYPYRDNNWVRIYDMGGKMVYEIDMPYDNPNIVADLPDGIYTVKTFTVGSAEPIQTFIIGK